MKKLLRFSILLTGSLLLLRASYAQVGINNPNPDPSAILDLNSEGLGLLIPRMSTLQRMAITDPAESLLVYDTDHRMYYYYDPFFNDFNWLALNPFNFRDGVTFRTHPFMNDMNLFESSGGDKTNAATSPRVWIDGQLIVGSFERPGVKGIMVEGDSKFKGTVTFDKNPVFTEGLPAPSGNIGALVDNPPPAEDTYNTTFQGYGTIPLGGIIMWSGNPDALPPGWAICDGVQPSPVPSDELGNAIVVPDLRERFIVGAGGSVNGLDNPTVVNDVGVAVGSGGYAVDSLGGTHADTLDIQHLPSHNHSFSATTSNEGSHSHSFTISDGGSGSVTNADNSGNDGSKSTSTNGAHTHSVSGTTSDAGTTNTKPLDNRPPFYALAFIIRVQ